MMYRAFFLSLFVVLVSCGSGSSNDNGSAEKNVSDIRSDYLNGKWSTGCFSPATGIYRVEEVAFEGLSFSVSIKWYEDELCSILDESYDEIDRFGSVEYGDLVIVESGVTARKIDTIIVISDTPKITEYRYSIFYVDEEVLYFGSYTSEYTGNTEEKRHKDLDYDYPFYRVTP